VKKRGKKVIGAKGN
jgi:dynein heavy chain